MNHKRSLLFSAISLLAGLIFGSCSQQEKYSQKPKRESQLRRPPAAVERAWLARHQYDPERRIVVPKYKGARWGSVLEYTEKENLVYRDWWVRDVKMQDLNPVPSTQLTPFSQIQDSGDAETVTQEDINSPVMPEDSTVSVKDSFSGDDEIPVLDSSDPVAPDQAPMDVDPFAPIEATPSADPFSPVPAPPESDPFAPLPL